MTDDQFVRELQNAGFLDEVVANKLRREAFLSGHSAEDLIYTRRLVDDKKLAEFKSTLFRVPYQKIDLENYDPSFLELIPEETVRSYGVVALGRTDDLLVVGMMHPDELKAQEALKFIARQNRLNLGVYLISYADWQAVMKMYSPYRSQIEAAVQALHIKSGETKRKLIELEGASGDDEEAPIIRIVADTFREAVSSGASDIHVEPQETYLRIRFRNNGDLHEVAALPVEIASAVVSRIKIISNLKIDESRIPQDGRFRSIIFDREVDFRLATFPTPLGEKVAIRVLDPTTGLKGFDQLGLVGKNLEMVQGALNRPYGMILVTGPTGSGKSTTLYALMQTLNKEDVNIVSLEDPVEYFISGLNQSQVRPEIGYDFASGLRQILRQDPDVILVGEIRDIETAGLAVHAALTGHIVLSTLHTNNAAGVIPRLIDMKIEPFLLPSALSLMIGQRLVSQLCQVCKQPEVGSAQVQEIIERAVLDLPKELIASYKKPYNIYHALGCQKCKGKGVAGRMALMEVFQMSRGLESIISEAPTLQKIVAEAKKQGMITLRQDGVLKALAGLVSIEEVVRESEDMD